MFLNLDLISTGFLTAISVGLPLFIPGYLLYRSQIQELGKFGRFLMATGVALGAIILGATIDHYAKSGEIEKATTYLFFRPGEPLGRP